MSKAKTQSQTRRARRIAGGLQSDMPNSTKITKSGRSLTTTRRTKKFSENLTK